MAGGDKIDICSSLFLQLQENFRQTVYGYGTSGLSQGDFPILAEYTL